MTWDIPSVFCEGCEISGSPDTPYRPGGTCPACGLAKTCKRCGWCCECASWTSPPDQPAPEARPASGADVIAFDMAHGDEGPVLEADDGD